MVDSTRSSEMTRSLYDGGGAMVSRRLHRLRLNQWTGDDICSDQTKTELNRTVLPFVYFIYFHLFKILIFEISFW